MANIDAPNGFKPVGHLDGSPWNGATRRCSVASGYGTALFPGDPIVFVANANSNGFPSIEAAGATAAPGGIIVSFDPDPDNPGRRYLPASSTGAYANVACSPDLICEVQANGTFEDGDVMSNASATAGSGSTTTGCSAYEIDVSTCAATSTLVYKVLGLVDREDNALGADAKLLVTFNIHQLGRGAGVTGLHA